MELITEYLIIIDKKESTSHYSLFDTAAKFNEYLTKNNSDIVINEGSITYKKNIICKYEIEAKPINDKEQRFFYLKIVFYEDESKIDDYDSLLSLIRTKSNELTNKLFFTLSDGISSYYSNKAYPLIFDVENLMRKLISYFLLITDGAEWKETSLPSTTKDAIRKSKRQDLNNALYQLDFIDLSPILFTPYQSKDNDTENLYKILKKTKKSEDLNLNQLKGFIPKSNWQRYFKDLVTCEDEQLKSRWKDLYDLRCNVAHNRGVTKNDFNEIEELVSEVTKPLNEAFNKRSEVVVSPEERNQLGINLRKAVESMNLSQFRLPMQQFGAALDERFKHFPSNWMNLNKVTK